MSEESVSSAFTAKGDTPTSGTSESIKKDRVSDVVFLKPFLNLPAPVPSV